MLKLKIGKKSGLKYFNMKDLRSWRPCYDPGRHLPESFSGTAVSILMNDKIPAPDRLWVVLRTDLVSEKVIQLFAVWSARQVEHFNSDPRVRACNDTAERFVLGQATVKELNAAKADAANAAANAAIYAASYAANAAAYYAAYAAEAAIYAANASAIYATAEAAIYAAANAAPATYASYARQNQVNKLIEMVKAEGLERVAKKKLTQK